MSELTPKDIDQIYSKLADQHALARKKLNRPLTLTEKILFAHMHDTQADVPVRGQSYALLKPDRVAMQDATAQMALLQFMQGGFNSVAVPTTVHCDHLIQARVGAEPDMENALAQNKEVFDFLKSASAKNGIGFWQPGAGIIHQVVLENYAFPGGMMIGTDSHTPNAGGLGMVAIGVGGADAVDVMVGQPWGITWPKLIGVRLTGSLNGWAAPKDVILKLAGILTVAGGTGSIIEYFGEGTYSISCTGKATITNMGAELGATTSVFPFDERMYTYLKATGREHIADSARTYKDQLIVDPEIEKSPEKFYDRVIEIDLNTLEPYVVGPHSPDLARPISKLSKESKEKGYPEKLTVALIGSCTNSSYEDMCRAAEVAAQAAEHGLKTRSKFMITPGSQQIYETIMRDGQLQTLEKIGGVVLANACGPCIGQWKRDDITPGESNSIITSFNRNFARRNDGNAETLAFIGSPELVTAMALGGSLAFNPLTDSLPGPDGDSVNLSPPKPAPEIPPRGFIGTQAGYVEPPKDGSKITVIISPDSTRLQLLKPFAAWDGKDFIDLAVLLKAAGKCTTDHISPAGQWLAYRGHLDKISDNMFTGAVNAFTDETGTGLDVLDGQRQPFPAVARHYKAEGLGWVVIGDSNYGEGSSREHAAMSPRYLGCQAVIVRSFARIHETNLKKQGVLALTFADSKDYDKVQETDRISILDLAKLASGKLVRAQIKHSDGKVDDIELNHTMTAEQIEWFKAGSALNLIRKQIAG
jgi:aconitate hydratase